MKSAQNIQGYHEDATRWAQRVAKAVQDKVPTASMTGFFPSPPHHAFCALPTYAQALEAQLGAEKAHAVLLAQFSQLRRGPLMRGQQHRGIGIWLGRTLSQTPGVVALVAQDMTNQRGQTWKEIMISLRNVSQMDQGAPGLGRKILEHIPTRGTQIYSLANLVRAAVVGRNETGPLKSQTGVRDMLHLWSLALELSMDHNSPLRQGRKDFMEATVHLLSLDPVRTQNAIEALSDQAIQALAAWQQDPKNAPGGDEAQEQFGVLGPMVRRQGLQRMITPPSDSPKERKRLTM